MLGYLRVLSEKSVMGNLSDIRQRLLQLRGGGGGAAAGAGAGAGQLVTGSTASLLDQLGSLCPAQDQDTQDTITLPSAQVTSNIIMYPRSNSRLELSNLLDIYSSLLSRSNQGENL